MGNRIRDAFDGIHAEDAIKRRTMAYLKVKTAAPSRGAHGRRLATALACFALVLLGMGGWRFYMTPVSAISVDVNPSIELGVNRFDRIVTVEGYNEDGSALAAAVDLQNMSYSDGLNTLMCSDAMRPYLGNDGFVSITVIGDTEEKSEEMRGQITACAYAAQPNVECQCGDRGDIAAAHEAGLSFGKYRAFLELQELDPEITVDDVRVMSMRQIKNKMEELFGSPYNAPFGNGSGDSGNGAWQGGGQHHGENDPLESVI